MQFASYPTAFNNTILKRFAGEVVRDFKDFPHMTASPKIISTAILMTSVAAFMNSIRSGGRSLEEDDSTIVLRAVDRWGGLGPAQYAYRFWKNAQSGSGQAASLLKAPSGPLAQDVIDSVIYRKGIVENMAGNVPFASVVHAISPEAMKAMQDEGKDIDKILFAWAAEKKKPKKVEEKPLFKSPYAYAKLYAKGGIVTDVPQAKEEPDERVDRMTGLPYNMQAGILGQDEEDRAGFAEGGGVIGEEEQEVYAFLTRDLRMQAPIFSDLQPIDGYTEEDLKEHALGITEPMYRDIKEKSREQDLMDFRDSETIGVHVSSTPTIDTALKGYVRLVKSLDLSDMDVPLEGFQFIEEIANNKELRSKIINNAIAPADRAKEHIDSLLFEHGLKKQVSEKQKNLPQLNKILNIVSSRETLKDIGYDSIIYEDADLNSLDTQMEDLNLRKPFALGGLGRLISGKLLNYLKNRSSLRKIISGYQTGVDEIGVKVVMRQAEQCRKDI